MNSPGNQDVPIAPDSWVCLNCETQNGPLATACEVCGGTEHLLPVAIAEPVKRPFRQYVRTAGLPGKIFTFRVNSEVIHSDDMTFAEYKKEPLTESGKSFLKADPLPVFGLHLQANWKGLWVLHQSNKLTLWDAALKTRRKELFLSGRGDEVTVFSGGYLLGAGDNGGQVMLRVYTESVFFKNVYRRLHYAGHVLPSLMATEPDAEVVAVVEGTRLITWALNKSTGLRSGPPVKESQTVGVTSLVVLPGGKMIVTGTGEGKIELRDPLSHELIRTVELKYMGAVICLTPDEKGELLFAGTTGGCFAVFDLAGEPLFTVILDGPVKAISYLAAEGRVAVSSGYKIHLFEVKAWASLTVIETQMDEVNALLLTEGERIFAGGTPGHLDLWVSEEPRLQV